MVCFCLGAAILALRLSGLGPAQILRWGWAPVLAIFLFAYNPAPPELGQQLALERQYGRLIDNFGASEGIYRRWQGRRAWGLLGVLLALFAF